MKDFQLRVVNEKQELDNKIAALTLFRETEVFDGLSEAECDRLLRQLDIMESYSSVLRERIENFT